MGNNAPTIPQVKRLVRRAQRGDAEAFEALVRPCADSLYRVAASCLGGREADVADAVQDTLMAAWANLGELDKPRYFKTWLIRICINACRQITRAPRPSAPLEEVPEERLADERAEAAVEGALEGDEGFRRLVAAAGPANAAAITLFYGEGYSTAEIADMLGLTPEGVRQRLSRGRKRIARTLSEDGDEADVADPSPAPRPPRTATAAPRGPTAGASGPRKARATS